MSSVTESSAPWHPLSAAAVAELLAGAPVRWWLSGGAALDRWLGHPIRERQNIDVTVTAGDLAALVATLPDGYSAWAPADDEGTLLPFAQGPPDARLQPVPLRDDASGAWVLQINAEDGAPRAWVYKRDPRVQLPWERVVRDV